MTHPALYFIEKSGLPLVMATETKDDALYVIFIRDLTYGELATLERNGLDVAQMAGKPRHKYRIRAKEQS